MAFCVKCGKEYNEGDNFCNGCGTPISENKTYNAQTTQDSNNASYHSAEPENFFENIVNTNDHTTGFDPDDISQNIGMGVIAYIPLICLLPFFMAKDSAFAQYHAKQGLNLFIIEIIYSVFCGIISLTFGISGWIFGFGWVQTLLFIPMQLGNLAFLGLMIFGIVTAASGKVKELPIINKFSIIK